MKTFFIFVVVAILIVGGVYFWIFPESLGGLLGSKPAPSPVVEQPVDTRSTYASSTLGLTLHYPQSYTLNDSYAYDAFGPKKLINGVKFTIPAEMATGTNLSSDSYVSVEWLPRAKSCTGDIYLKASVKARPVTDGGVQYSLATSSGAAAGNIYEEWVYAIPASSPCTAVRYFIHSGNIGNYPAGTVREFDKAALIAAFDDIRHSLQLETASTAPTSTSTTPVQ